jgi:hypothetical protein
MERPPPPPTLVRARAAEQVRLRFLGKPFVWGECDCARLVALDLKLLGYRPALARFGGYKNARAAVAGLRRAGFKSIHGVLDDLGLQRIPWSLAMAGDVVALPSHEVMPALGVVLTPGLVIAFDVETDIGRLLQPPIEIIETVWACPPTADAPADIEAEAV